MIIVARKYVASKSTLFITATLCEAFAVAFLIAFVRNTPALEFFWFIPFAVCILFLVGPFMVWIGLSEHRKDGVAMFFDRDGVWWERSGAFFFFWQSARAHYRHLKWDDILGAKVVQGTHGEYTGHFVIIGVSQCEWLTAEQLKWRQEFVLVNLGRPPWDRTLPILNQGDWLWKPQEVVAKIEQTLSDKNAREQWGEPPQWQLTCPFANAKEENA
jgi:hypothetical protein